MTFIRKASAKCNERHSMKHTWSNMDLDEFRSDIINFIEDRGSDIYSLDILLSNFINIKIYMLDRDMDDYRPLEAEIAIYYMKGNENLRLATFHHNITDYFDMLDRIDWLA